MEPHLAHRLPWTSLGEAIKSSRTRLNVSYKSAQPTEKQLKTLFHFARCLVDAVREFAATDKSSDEEKEEFDARNWDADAWHPAFSDLGYYDSIPVGYVQLNLLLTDPKAFESILLFYHRRTATLDALRGANDGEHPEVFAAHIQQAFDGNRMKPLTADVRQILRDHAAKMFRCMYSLLTPSGELDTDLVATRIALAFGWGEHLGSWCSTHHRNFTSREDPRICPTCRVSSSGV